MIQDFIHEFKGFGAIPSKCRVSIVSDNNFHLVCFEDIGEGTSVTNATEQLASEIVEILNTVPSNCRFFETYSQYDYDTFDEITYQWTIRHGKWNAKDPDWVCAEDKIKSIFICC